MRKNWLPLPPEEPATGVSEPDPVKPNQTKSNRIKLNQIQSNQINIFLLHDHKSSIPRPPLERMCISFGFLHSTFCLLPLFRHPPCTTQTTTFQFHPLAREPVGGTLAGAAADGCTPFPTARLRPRAGGTCRVRPQNKKIAKNCCARSLTCYTSPPLSR